MVWYGMVCYGMVWYGTVCYGMVWFGMVWHGFEWYGMVWHGSFGFIRCRLWVGFTFAYRFVRVLGLGWAGW